MKPNFFKAKIAYSEHVGSNKHASRNLFGAIILYRNINLIDKKTSITFVYGT